MTEVRNHIGQTLLRLKNTEVVNHAGQTIARVQDGRLLNSRGQQLATAEADGTFTTHGGAGFKLEGDALLGPSGSELGTVTGGSPLERALAAAAYVEFYLDS